MDKIDKLSIELGLPVGTPQESAIAKSESIYAEFVKGAIEETFEDLSDFDVKAGKIVIDLGCIDEDDIPYVLRRELGRELSLYARRPENSEAQHVRNLVDAFEDNRVMEYARKAYVSSMVALTDPDNDDSPYHSASLLTDERFKADFNDIVGNERLTGILIGDLRKDKRAFYRLVDLLDKEQLGSLAASIGRVVKNPADACISGMTTGGNGDVDTGYLRRRIEILLYESQDSLGNPAHTNFPEHSMSRKSPLSQDQSAPGEHHASQEQHASPAQRATSEQLISQEQHVSPEQHASPAQRISQEQSVSGDIPYDVAIQAEQYRRNRTEYLENIINLQDTDETDEHIHIDDAGLIILSPFFQNFFKSLGYLDGRGLFNSTENRLRAVHMLRAVAMGADAPQCDNQLPFCKILCGLSTMFPAGNEFIMTEEERGELTNMLMAVKNYWRSLKNSSIETLRTGFLQRHGSLEFEDGQWLLRVEGKAQDILMDEIPWGFLTYKSNWSEHIIITEWQKEF